MKSQTFIVLLRGINVSGQKLIKMELLRKAFADAGFANVRTYIQSGNVIANIAANADAVREKATKLIAGGFGFKVGVVILTPDELKYALDSLPFEGPGNKVYLGFLSSAPDAQAVAAWQNIDWGQDRATIIGRVIYIWYGDSAGNSKLTLNEIEKKLGVVSTMRNLNTSRRLLELAGGPA